MASSAHCVRTLLLMWLALGASPAGAGAWDVAVDGSVNNRSAKKRVSEVRGAQSFFLDDPMETRDWADTGTVTKSLALVRGANGNKAAPTNKVATLMEELRPIFTVMPKDAAGRLSNGTARYALHRFFVEKHGWSVKGLQPAGAAAMATMSADDLEEITKYMVPSLLQDLLTRQSGTHGFDLQSIAGLAAAMEHLVHTDVVKTIYSVFRTLGLKISGRRTEEELDLIFDTYVMVYAFGLDLDVSMLDDVLWARSYLEKSHSGWSTLREFAKSKRVSFEAELSFDDVVQVAEMIGEGYAKLQAADCGRVRNELAGKPSYRAGRVQMSELTPSHAPGRRSLLTESVKELEELGVLSDATAAGNRDLIVPNYINSQATCLSTASFYTACCVNECEGFLAVLEREANAPEIAPERLAAALLTLPVRPTLEQDAILQELKGLADKDSSLVTLHGRAFSTWMHQAFPLECPAPSEQGATNPKTPEEWMGSGSMQVQPLETMIWENGKALKRYTTDGKEPGPEIYAPRVPNATNDVVRFRRRLLRVRKVSNGMSYLSVTAIFPVAMLVVGAVYFLHMSTTSSSKKAQKGIVKEADV